MCGDFKGVLTVATGSFSFNLLPHQIMESWQAILASFPGKSIKFPGNFQFPLRLSKVGFGLGMMSFHLQKIIQNFV